MSGVGCAILAAGASRRLGRPKQLLPWRGQPLLRHIARQALKSGADQVAVIVGAHAEAVLETLEGLPLTCVVNLGWCEGIASSIRCAAHWANQRDLQALALATSDQPYVDASHLDRLYAEHQAGAAQVASSYDGVLGVPALFDATLFRRLLTLGGDAGAAALLRKDPTVRRIDWPAGAVDLDSVRDLEVHGVELGM